MHKVCTIKEGTKKLESGVELLNEDAAKKNGNKIMAHT